MSLGYYTLAEIMRIYRVRRSYVYKLACLHRWGRYRHPDGGVRYRREDVDRSLSEAATRRHDQASGKVWN